MRSLKLICLPVLYVAARLSAAIVFSGVMKDPIGAEDACPGGACLEYVELCNTGRDTVDLNGAYFSDGIDKSGIVLFDSSFVFDDSVVTKRMLIYPGEFALILDRDYFDASVSSRYKIAQGSIVLTVATSQITGGLTVSKGLALCKPDHIGADSILSIMADSGVEYQTGTRLTCASPVNAIEGSEISVSSLIDKEATWVVDPSGVSAGTHSSAKAFHFIDVKSFPLGDSVLCIVKAAQRFADVGAISSVQIRSSNKTLYTKNLAGDKTFDDTMRISTSTISGNNPELIVSSSSKQSIVPLDLSSFSAKPSLRVSELAPSASPEWIELTNISDLPIRMSDFSIVDMSDGDTIALPSCQLKPGEYVAISSDTVALLARYPGIPTVKSPHWSALNNYGARLVLVSQWQNPIDTVRYRSGIALSHSAARINVQTSGDDSLAFADCASPTPGLPDPRLLANVSSEPIFTAGPVPFTPDGDGRADLFVMKLSLPSGASASLKILSIDGCELRDFGEVAAGKTVWDGLDSHGRKAPRGPFIAVLRISRNGSVQMIRSAGVLWR